MKEIKEKILTKGTVLLLIILTLGIYLRADNIYNTPRDGATHDEYAWTWLGINIIQNGVPSSWSPHPQYPHREPIVYHNAPYFIVTPYLEHPPIFGLVAGSYALLSGATNMYDVTLQNMRGLALILGGASIILLYFFTRQHYGENVGLITAFLYAIIPTVAIGSRIVQNENFMIPVWLGMLILTSIAIKSKNIWVTLICGAIGGILMLAKVPWFAASFSVAILLIYHGLYKQTFIFLSIVIAIFSLFFVYGFYFDADTFIKLWGLQLARYDLTFSSVYALWQKPFMVDRYLTDGWIFFGWIAFLIVTAKNTKKHIFLISAVVSYLLIFVAGIPDEPGHGWYRYPFYPFLVISIAVFLKEYFTKNWFLTFTFLLLTTLSLLASSWEQELGFSYFVFRIFLVIIGFTLVPIYLPTNKMTKLAKISAYSMFCVIVILSISTILLYSEI